MTRIITIAAAVLCLGIVAQPHTIYLLFDEAHQGRRTLMWSRALEIAERFKWKPEWAFYDFTYMPSNYWWIPLTEPIDGRVLAGKTAIVFTSPSEDLSGDELLAIQDYLQEGGTVLFFGDYRYYPPQNFAALLASFGISVNPRRNFRSGEPAVVEGFGHVYVSNWGESLNLEPGVEGVQILFTGNYFPAQSSLFAVAAQKGIGKLVALGDDKFHQRCNQDFLIELLDKLFKE